MSRSRLFLAICGLVLMGQGCFGGSSGQAADGGVFKSANRGDTWEQVSVVPGPKGVGTLGNSSVMTLEMDPQDSDVLYLGTRTGGLLYSENGGESWMQSRESTLRGGLISAVEVSPVDVCTVYVAKGPRLYKTDDCLRTFDDERYVETRSGVSIQQITVDWFNPDVVWIGLSNGDVLKSADGAKTWRTMLSTKNDITSLLLHNRDSRIILVGTDKDGFYKSADAGENWVQIEKELRDFRNGNRIISMVQDETSGTVIAATKFGLLRSVNFGDSWEAIDLLTAPGQVTIKSLAVDPKNPDTIYYAALSTFYTSFDGGNAWTTQQLPTTKLPETMVIDPSNPSVLYVGVASPEKK